MKHWTNLHLVNILPRCACAWDTHAERVVLANLLKKGESTVATFRAPRAVCWRKLLQQSLLPQSPSSSLMALRLRPSTASMILIALCSQEVLSSRQTKLGAFHCLRSDDSLTPCLNSRTPGRWRRKSAARDTRVESAFAKLDPTSCAADNGTMAATSDFHLTSVAGVAECRTERTTWKASGLRPLLTWFAKVRQLKVSQKIVQRGSIAVSTLSARADAAACNKEDCTEPVENNIWEFWSTRWQVLSLAGE